MYKIGVPKNQLDKLIGPPSPTRMVFTFEDHILSSMLFQKKIGNIPTLSCFHFFFKLIMPSGNFASS